MARRLEDLSVEELEQALVRKRHVERQRRLQRLQDEGRVIDSGVEPPPPAPVRGVRPANLPTFGNVVDSDTVPDSEIDSGPESESESEEEPGRPINWRWVFNKFLLFVEVGAAVGFLAVLFMLVTSVRELNQDAAVAQQQVVPVQIAAEPTFTVEPLIDLIVLPGGHQPPVDGREIVYVEAGDIPTHLLPLIDAYVPPAIPTPSSSQPRQISIPSIDVNAPIVQGHEPDQLKKGVGHAIGSAMPGDIGNMVLSAHNDIYGEIFRHLDKLAAGDEVQVSNGSQEFTYVINEIRVVDPTAVEVMGPTDHASLTLISCYPYLINNKRIVVFADLVEDNSLGIDS